MLRLYLLLLIFLTACSNFPCSKLLNKAEKKNACESYVKLGMALIKEREFVDAKDNLLIAEKIDPRNSAVWYGLAYLNEIQNDIVAARKNYHQALVLAPRDGAVQNNYGTFLCRRGKYLESIQHFLLAVKDPFYLEAAMAYENAGLCALKIPDEKLAIDLFQKALAREPKLNTSRIKLRELYKKEYH